MVKKRKSRKKSQQAPGIRRGQEKGRPLLSLCMIVRNEEKFLPGCLESVKDFVDEIVIIDTGSTDSTMSIARNFGARVYEHPWEHNFAKHRNQSISHAKGDWIFILDADEELISSSGKYIRKAIKDESIDSIAVQVHNLINEGNGTAVFNSVRLFRNYAEIRYEGSVHNQEVGCSNTKYYPIQILHHGYNLDEAQTKTKFHRTSSLLLKQIAGEPNNPLPHHYLAVSYMSMGPYDSTCYHKAIAESNLAIRLAADKLNDDPAYLGTHYVAAASHFSLGNMDEAKKVCERALEIFPDHLDSCYLLTKIYDRTDNCFEASRYAETYLSIRRSIERHPERFGKIINNSFSEVWIIDVIRAKAIYELGLKDKSRDMFREIISKVPSHWEVLMSIGYFYFSKSDFGEAKNYLEIASKIKNEKISLYMLCECYCQLGNIDAQIRVLSKLVALFPDEIANLKKIGIVQLEKSNFKVANYCLSKVVDNGDVSPEIIQALDLAKRKVEPHTFNKPVR